VHNQSQREECIAYVYVSHFSTAFDCIQRNILFHVLIKNNVNCKTLRLLRSMYSQLKVCVKTNIGLTEYVHCNVGTRQGCMLSPFLFVLFLNEFIEMLSDHTQNGIYVNGDVGYICQTFIC
jgi:hypothetical protein